MVKQLLHEGWEMRGVKEEGFLPAQVPGSVYADLLAAGRMEDPFWRDNELAALKLMEEDYEYRTEFVPAQEILEAGRAVLRFEGLDTLADLYLNGQFLDSVHNMHRTWDYEVSDLLKAGKNELRLVFHSPTKFIREAYKEDPADGSSDAMLGFPLLRKAHCMFGWDWGPRLPDAGIWRAVSLLGIQTAAIDSVYLTQEHGEGKVELHFEVELDCTEPACVAEDCTDPEGCGLAYEVTVTDPEGTSRVYTDSPEAITITEPKLWWPNGYGEQALYTVKVRLLEDEVELDAWERRIGLRTMTMHIEKDEYGESFAHEVNGVQIFAMGADYIPEDNILSRVDKERTRKLLQECKDANFNVIRVWGGGYYPGDEFFDLCDEMGLVVWQDFMFACAVYNLNEDFEENITQEFIDNIKRIRHHASLGLWCGNNEMEMFVASGSIGFALEGLMKLEGPLAGLAGGSWVRHPRQKSDYVKMYEYIIPKVLGEFDPNTFYWPASPSSGGAFDNPNDENRGDVHYWSVWHGNLPFPAYRSHFFRYVSEFGFQSFPCLKTVESFTEPEDRNIFSYVMEKHQRNDAANGKIMNYLSATYLYPSDFGVLLYASQLLQADAIKYGVEHFRRNRGRCMGAVYWQLNDCWPVASWSSIDYFGRLKALHYYARRFFAPVLLSCEEEGILTQNTNVNAEPYEVKKSIRLSVANETRDEVRLTVRWALRDRYAKVLREEAAEVAVAPLTSLWLDRVELPEARLYEDYVSFEAVDEAGKIVSYGTVIFSAPKHFKFVDPQLCARVEGDEIVVKAGAYARSVEIRNENEDLRLEDNYFDMNAGERRVKVLSGDVSEIRVRSVYDIR